MREMAAQKQHCGHRVLTKRNALSSRCTIASTSSIVVVFVSYKNDVYGLLAKLL